MSKPCIGYPERRWETSVGSLAVRIARLQTGRYLHAALGALPNDRVGMIEGDIWQLRNDPRHLYFCRTTMQSTVGPVGKWLTRLGRHF